MCAPDVQIALTVMTGLPTVSRHIAPLFDAYLGGADLLRGPSGTPTSATPTSRNVFLRFADLAFADLRRADFTDADLVGANLYRARLSGADITGADLSLTNRYIDHIGPVRTDADMRTASDVISHTSRGLSHAVGTPKYPPEKWSLDTPDGA